MLLTRVWLELLLMVSILWRYCSCYLADADSTGAVVATVETVTLVPVSFLSLAKGLARGYRDSAILVYSEKRLYSYCVKGC